MSVHIIVSWRFTKKEPDIFIASPIQIKLTATPLLSSEQRHHCITIISTRQTHIPQGLVYHNHRLYDHNIQHNTAFFIQLQAEIHTVLNDVYLYVTAFLTALMDIYIDC